jgi:hypothetical protein
MSMISVSSAAIAAIGYSGGTLFVQFHSSTKIYSHHGVPFDVYAAFIHALFKGVFYSKNIRGRYR